MDYTENDFLVENILREEDDYDDENVSLDEAIGENEPITLADIIPIINQDYEEPGDECIISISVEAYDVDSGNSRKVIAKSLQNPAVKICVLGDYLQVDLMFKRYTDADLKLFWHALEKYGLLLNDACIKSGCREVPSFTMMISTIDHLEDFFFISANPLFWSLTAMSPGEETNTIRIMFNIDDVGVLESDIDADEIIAEEIKKEKDEIQKIESENRYLEAEEKRDSSKKGYAEEKMKNTTWERRS